MKDYREVRGHLLDMLEELDDGLGQITNNRGAGDSSQEQDFCGQTVDVGHTGQMDDAGHAMAAEIEKIRQAISRIKRP
ncbi:MAG: hypothetical protein KGZ80_07730 [Methylomonas sp.]|nr:hypothetical protein [Methylomonas sp.]PPD20034.1 MAG: hypothetical protein CTY23_10160 [Methylomonas sp.]PPD25897.1 MAG: hypothetical protein CTY22_07025 [Methylomonas sp.]PPD37343.1 MAG: hypothetical protein CTY21_07025 [Methylomonas sp.]PPD40115.1 MAG: hypothetical protein CTY17_07230 [Methylomonas sp.]